MATRAQFIAKAREYLGTPCAHQGRRKGPRGRIDCLGLLLCVSEDLQLADKDGKSIRATDYANYPPMQDVHEECARRLVLVAHGAALTDPTPGDVVSLRLARRGEGGMRCHLAIVTYLRGSLGMIHALSLVGKVSEHILDAKWRRRITGIFSVPGLT